MRYLASPYSDPNPEVRNHRFRAVCKTAALLIYEKEVVFCPIAHSHPIEVVSPSVIPESSGGGWEFWQHQDIPFLEACDEMSVLCIPGWSDSEGVQAEVDWWQANRGYGIDWIHEGHYAWPIL